MTMVITMIYKKLVMMMIHQLFTLSFGKALNATLFKSRRRTLFTLNKMRQSGGNLDLKISVCSEMVSFKILHFLERVLNKKLKNVKKKLWKK
jgi:hypothetical protein